eukprot:GFUD01120132.1.p1 GENE.GFUD01120132.1~~GFUD01120132.1.p1  ORF type:complete len:192 (+),score=18.51 GFUD01120132.1:45-620(+)
MDESDDNCTEKKARLWEMPAHLINQLNPFRDDPLKSCNSGLNENCVAEKGEHDALSVQSKPTTLCDFCQCEKCILMAAEAENICCKARKFCIAMPESKCVTEHEDFKTIINKTVLTINLKTIWNTGAIDTDDTEISHKNLRYSAYRSLFIWLRNGKRKNSCVVNSVRQLYPDVAYTGFCERSPVYKKARKN